MTTDEFDTRYKLLKQITRGEGRSFTAQERASGRGVLVHFLDGGAEADSLVVSLIDRLEPRDRSKVLEVLVVNGSTAVITQVLEGFQGFDTWLRARLPESPAPRPVPPEDSTGDFTRMFAPAGVGPPAPSPPVPPVPAPPAAPPPAASATAPPSSSAAPEEGFTELFQPPESRTDPIPVRAAPPVTPKAPPKVPPKTPPKMAPEAPQGGFTDLFQPPPQSRTDPIPAPAPAKPPVELRSIRIPLGQPPPPSPRPAVPPPAWPSAPAFEPPVPPPSLKPVVPVPRLGPRPGEPIVKPPAQPVVKPPARDAFAPTAPPPAWGGESDYTRQLRPASTPSEPAAQAPAPPRPGGPPAGPSAGPPEPPASPKSIVPLLLVLNIVVVIMTGVILYFALKRQ
jgi:hypothetical protein